MATVYKNFLSSDVVNTRTLLHEAIPITGSIISGTYGPDDVDIGSEPHIKTYSHGMFESIYDYPYLSSSANHIFDITVGYSARGALSSSANQQNAKKISIYNQMAQVLAGYDHTGSIREFDADGDLTAGQKMQECIFLNFSRLLTKDEIKKGTFDLKLGVAARYKTDTSVQNAQLRITDASGSDKYFVNSPAGEYGVLYATGAVGLNLFGAASTDPGGQPVGLLYYQAGIAVLSGSVFNTGTFGGILGVHDGSGIGAEPQLDVYSNAGGEETGPLGHGFHTVLTGGTVANMADGIRNRIFDLSFDNTTELNSAIHFCRINHNEYNYSSNPTYLTGSKIRVKGSNRKNLPVSYITSIGLYSADRELLAVAKLSEPLKKDPTSELTLKVRLDY
tara:strand:+ start:1063 stop:2235 length:1173 start_codon:yes stop_codon:yes gene_type:complete